jgi:hypothetical protein
VVFDGSVKESFLVKMQRPTNVWKCIIESQGEHTTPLVVFGNPSAGTPVMIAAPLAALDQPLKR